MYPPGYFYAVWPLAGLGRQTQDIRISSDDRGSDATNTDQNGAYVMPRIGGLFNKIRYEDF
jgi:hypothetical protein